MNVDTDAGLAEIVSEPASPHLNGNGLGLGNGIGHRHAPTPGSIHAGERERGLVGLIRRRTQHEQGRV